MVSKSTFVFITVLILLILCSLYASRCPPEMFQLTNAPEKPTIDFTMAPEMEVMSSPPPTFQ